MHHFKSPASLVEGLALQAMEGMDKALTAASAHGNVVETWLRLSSSRDQTIHPNSDCRIRPLGGSSHCRTSALSLNA